MLNIPAPIRVFLCTQPADMRKQFDGLHGLVAEVLRQEDRLGQLRARRRDVVDHACAVRIAAAQERSPRRVADRVLAIRAIESYAPRGEAIDIRRLNQFVAVAAEVVVQVVGHDEHDVLARWLFGIDRSNTRRDSRQDD